MKRFIVSFATVVLFCQVVLIGSGLANNGGLVCMPFDGCTSTSPDCYSSSGTCPKGCTPPLGGACEGNAYGALEDVTRTVWSCVPTGTECFFNTNLPFCLEYAYDAEIGGICGKSICSYNNIVAQCLP
jgi:hypothetical protein